MTIHKGIGINFIKVVVFLLLLVLLLRELLSVFNYKDMGGGGGWQRFYEAEDNSIDVLFFGSSHAHCSIDHRILWEDYGIAGYTMSAGAQKIDSTYYFVKETMRSQKPKVIAIEVLGVTGGELDNGLTEVYRNTLGMEWSGNYLKYTDYFTEELEKDGTWKREILAKLPVVHARYKEVVAADFEDNISFMRGYRGSNEIVSFEKPQATDEEMDLQEDRCQWLLDIIELAEESGTSLVLFASPFVASPEVLMQYNKVASIATEHNVPFINFNRMYEEIGIDFGRDFRDTSHLNNEGAAKVTHYFGEYLKGNYEIPDRRGEKGYELWAQNALYLNNKDIAYKLEAAADINEYLQCLSENSAGQMIVLALTGNYGAQGEVYLEKLKLFGITDEEYYAGGVFVFEDGNRNLYLPGKEYQVCLPVKSGEIHLESSVYQNADGEEAEASKLLLNSQNYRMVDNGVNILVYNEEVNQLIDAAGVDIYMGLSMTHYEKPEE